MWYVNILENNYKIIIEILKIEVEFKKNNKNWKMFLERNC